MSILVAQVTFIMNI